MEVDECANAANPPSEVAEPMPYLGAAPDQAIAEKPKSQTSSKTTDAELCFVPTPQSAVEEANKYSEGATEAETQPKKAIRARHGTPFFLWKSPRGKLACCNLNRLYSFPLFSDELCPIANPDSLSTCSGDLVIAYRVKQTQARREFLKIVQLCRETFEEIPHDLGDRHSAQLELIFDAVLIRSFRLYYDTLKRLCDEACFYIKPHQLEQRHLRLATEAKFLFMEAFLGYEGERLYEERLQELCEDIHYAYNKFRAANEERRTGGLLSKLNKLIDNISAFLWPK